MSTTATPSPSPIPAAPALTQVQRVVYTFTAPSRTMTDIGRSASWWLPWLVTSVVSLLFIFAIDSKIGFKQIVQSQMERMTIVQQALERMPADQREKALASQVRSAQISSYATPAFALGFSAVGAALLLAVFNFGFGAQLKFAKVFAIVVYSSLVSAVKILLGAIVLLAGGLDPASFDANNPIATNPSHLMSPDNHRFLYSLAQAFDIFVIWAIALVALGVARNSKVKARTAFLTLFALYFLFRVAAGGIAVALS